MVPPNITQEQVYKAAEEIIRSGIPAKDNYTNYHLIIDNHKLPLKYVLSIAGKHAYGVELPNYFFEMKRIVQILQDMGFQVEEDPGAFTFHEELIHFINQAATDNLKTSEYKRTFAGLTVKVSFGAGNKARVPWIAFLNKVDKVQDGIYPVFLYYMEQKLLILAYGLSETNKSKRAWKLDKPKSVTQYFTENQLGQPSRYGSSYVFKAYNLSQPLDNSQIDEDLLDIINFYYTMEGNASSAKRNTKKNAKIEVLAFSLSSFIKALDTTGLSFNPTLVTRLVSSLLTKPFVILTGLSGSGKTKLAQAFVQWICKDAQQYCIVPVGADWTNREPLLGYPNSLNQQEYVKPDNDALDLIINANNHLDTPYFLILDEMNLSHVERYFADFLSVMESHDTIPLHVGANKSDVPSKIKWPANLFIIGTVNIDETTNMFSPKVLDRANTIEFRVTDKEMAAFLNNTRSINMHSLQAAGSSMATHFLQLARTKSLPTEDINSIHQTLIDFFKELRKMGAEFGYRSATEILQLIYQLGIADDKMALNEKLDIAIMQKLLPKLHGSRRKLCPVLVTLGALCLPTENIEKDVFEVEDFNYTQEQVRYPLSLEKITRMYRSAIDNGFASFAEA